MYWITNISDTLYALYLIFWIEDLELGIILLSITWSPTIIYFILVLLYKLVYGWKDNLWECCCFQNIRNEEGFRNHNDEEKDSFWDQIKHVLKDFFYLITGWLYATKMKDLEIDMKRSEKYWMFKWLNSCETVLSLMLKLYSIFGRRDSNPIKIIALIQSILGLMYGTFKTSSDINALSSKESKFYKILNLSTDVCSQTSFIITFLALILANNTDSFYLYIFPLFMTLIYFSYIKIFLRYFESKLQLKNNLIKYLNIKGFCLR